ncbi:GDSL esterase/lipase At3g26430 [Selaginella moellendorffii]|uniref:GDSL esterase/lipase At3g26430 n=1 Tax=Selaginella moellendorffii TaxID=88036 RepID=UPI000D1C5486|nr:GDSL esterase/lipase At3g26430 [Selaginella moellendorffii]|eukprot:XP_002985984.2 GDSL esterase/lipase At3g26430 [Selaginella moellendorffii]
MASCSGTVLAIFALLLNIVLLSQARATPATPKSSSSICPTAVFTFADSLSDGGNRDIEAGGGKTLSGRYPYGITYGKPTGRYCDGLVIPDLLLQKLRLDNLGTPSLKYNGTEFESLNFGYAGATVIKVENQPYSSPHVLSAQVDDFVRHQEFVEGRYGRQASKPWYENALYSVEIGGDDINFGLPLGGGHVINVTIPAVIQGLADGIQKLYAHGARHVVLYNMPRADCSPNYLQSFQQYPAGTFHYDKDGCIVEIAQIISYFNTNIQRLTEELTQKYQGLTVYYFDWFAANTYVLENMKEFGFTNSLQSCCGGGGKFNCDGEGLCGCAPLNQTNAVYTVCKDPSKYFTFDGIHYTEHFYEIMSEYIMAGEYITPKVKLEMGCKIVTVPESPL